MTAEYDSNYNVVQADLVLLEQEQECPPLPIEIPAWKNVQRYIGGVQHIYRFNNGYGASVVRGPWTYGGPEGLYAVAVIRFTGSDSWEITYKTRITNDVIGHLDIPEIAELLIRIAALPAEVT